MFNQLQRIINVIQALHAVLKTLEPYMAPVQDPNNNMGNPLEPVENQAKNDSPTQDPDLPPNSGLPRPTPQRA